MCDQGRVKVGLFRDGQLQHHGPVVRQGIEALGQRRQQQGLGLGLVGALDEDLRLDDGQQAVGRDPGRQVELLRHDGANPVLRGQVDHRSHLGPVDPERRRPAEQGVEPRDRLHQADAVALGLKPLVDLEEGNDAALLPQVGRHGLAFRLPVHGGLEQDGRDDLVAREGRRRDDAHPHLVHQLEHGGVAVVGAVRDPVVSQRARRRTAALVEGGDEAVPLRDLSGHLFVSHALGLARCRFGASSRSRRARAIVDARESGEVGCPCRAW